MYWSPTAPAKANSRGHPLLFQAIGGVQSASRTDRKSQAPGPHPAQAEKLLDMIPTGQGRDLKMPARERSPVPDCTDQTETTLAKEVRKTARFMTEQSEQPQTAGRAGNTACWCAAPAGIRRNRHVISSSALLAPACAGPSRSIHPAPTISALTIARPVPGMAGTGISAWPWLPQPSWPGRRSKGTRKEANRTSAILPCVAG